MRAALGPVTELSLAERELRRTQRELDLMLLRFLMQRRIEFVSPLLLDIMKEEGFDLFRFLWRIRTKGRGYREAWAARSMGRYAFPLTHWRYRLPYGW